MTAPEGGGGDVHNVADLLRRAATTAPRHAGLVVGSDRWTWAELDRRVDGLAAGLVELGLRPGDRVALVAGAGEPFVTSWFATLRAGLVAVPLNPGYTARELAHHVEDSGARVVLAESDPADPADRAEGGDPSSGAAAGAYAAAERVVRIGSAAWEALAAATVGPVATSTGGADLAALVYTSGTSGRPRGAMLSHRALLANLEQMSAVTPPVATAHDVVLIPVPLFHIYGLNTGLDLAVAHAATVVLTSRFDPVAAFELISRERVTVVVGAPPMYLAWSMLPPDRAGFAQVRIATSGSAPLPPAVLERMGRQTGCTVYEGYGMTEAAPVLTLTPPATAVKPGSVGRPLPGVDLRLDPAPGMAATAGEVVVRGPNLFSGYWPDGAGGPDADGWFKTGDVGELDADGDLRLVDRLGDVILVSGFNVYPREVEDVLRSHPGVADVVVLATPHPYTGETVRALVVPAAAQPEGVPVTSAGLIAYAAGSLARYKCPTVVEWVSALPHSVTGKVSRGRLARP